MHLTSQAYIHGTQNKLYKFKVAAKFGLYVSK